MQYYVFLEHASERFFTNLLRHKPCSTAIAAQRLNFERDTWQA
jgi:hypothetical protein